MTAFPELSVVICVRNGARTILRQLQALDSQRGHPGFEIIIVDNGSTDSTAEVVGGWISSRDAASPQAQLTHADARAHIPYARNIGAAASSGRIIAYCDADDRVDEGWVAAIAAALPDEGMVGGRIEGISPDGSPKPDTFPHGLTQTPYLPHAGNCNMAITRGCFEAVGGYDESLPRYGFEDVDLSWRVQEAGYPLRYCPEAVVYFSISPKVKAIKKEFLIAQGRVAMAQRHPDAYQGFTAWGTLQHFLLTALRTPVRMAKPGNTPRSRHLRHLIDAAGFLVGYVRYGRTKSSN